MNSKRKGNAGERELRRILQERYGLEDAQRTEGSGRYGDGDIKNVPGLHIEAKRTERVNLYKAYEQATGDLGVSEKIPVVFHRRNNGGWMAFLSLDDLMRLYLPKIEKQHPENNQLRLGE